MNNDIRHFGVMGMRWGRRKHQPSSARSSALAGLYAATGNKRIGQALNKSNDKDAKKWEAEKNKEKEKSKRKAEKKAFKQEVKAAMKNGVGGKYHFDKHTGELQIDQFYNSKNQKIGKEEAFRIMNAASRRQTMRNLAGTAAVLTGAAIVGQMLSR